MESSHPRTDQIVIRIATFEDSSSLQWLAELDSEPPLTGAMLLAEAHEGPVAGLSLADGREIANPFVPTTEVLELLRLRASQLKPRLAPPDAFARHRPRRIPRARSLRLLSR